MRYKVVGFIALLCLITAANILFQGASSSETRAANVRPAPHMARGNLRSAFRGVDLAIKVGNAVTGCVSDGQRVAFLVLVGSIHGSSSIASKSVTVTFQNPSHLDRVSASGPDWAFKKDGSLFTGDYQGGYPIRGGDVLGAITVTGIARGAFGGNITLTASVATPDEVHNMSNNTASSTILLCGQAIIGHHNNQHIVNTIIINRRFTSVTGVTGTTGVAGSTGSTCAATRRTPCLPSTGSDPNA